MAHEHISPTQQQKRSSHPPSVSSGENTESSSEWDALLKSSSSIESQSHLLGNPGLTPIQRQALASRVGHISGNHHLQRVLAHAATIQRDDDEETSEAQTEESVAESTPESAESSEGAEQESQEEGHSHGDGVEPDVIPQTEGGAGKKDYLEKTVALKVLQDSFGTYKTMVEGTVKILAQAEFQAAYDKIYGTTDYSWEKYVKVKFGNLGGFAYENVNYINSNIASSTTVPHEMLHNNAHSSWSGFVGSNIDEGTTEYLTFQALTASKYTGMTSKYPNQYGVIKELVAMMGDAALKDAYFKGTNEDLRKAFNQKCKGAWVDFKKKMDEGNWTQAKALAVANT